MKIKLSALLLAALTVGAVSSSHAAPAGPSARAAASLKKNPRTQWLAHYLPDDRYKIAGGVWKYVTTNLDTYYHRPDSPNMMKQPNSNVIGFASAQAAAEAGYSPDPRDGTLQQVRGNIEEKQFVKEQESVLAAQNGGTRTFIKPSGKVILADGRSTIVVPNGWTRLISQRQPNAGADSSDLSIDLVMHPASKKMAFVGSILIPNVDVGRELSSGKFSNRVKMIGDMANSSGKVSNTGGVNVGSWFNQAKVNRTRWGGLNGVAMSPPPGVGAKAGNIIMVGRGNKLYMFMLMGEGKAPANTAAMIKSFVPR